MNPTVQALEADIAVYIAEGPENPDDPESVRIHDILLDRFRRSSQKFDHAMKLKMIPDDIVIELIIIRDSMDGQETDEIIRDVFHVLQAHDMHQDSKIIKYALMIVLKQFLTCSEYRAYDIILDEALGRNQNINKEDGYFNRKPYGYPVNGDIIGIEKDEGITTFQKVINCSLFTMQTVALSEDD